MRILIITNYYPPVEIGGWEQLTYDVAQELMRRDHQVHVVTSNRLIDQVAYSDPHVSRVLFLESPDHLNYHIQYSFTHRWQEMRNVDYLTGIISEFKPDIIYINGMWNLPHSLAQSAEKLMPERVVYYMASYWPTEPDAHSAYWSSTANNGLRRLPKSILGKIFKQYFISSPPRNQLDFHLVLCVSSYIQKYLIEEANVPPEQTRVVHNGIDLELFKFNPRQVENTNLRLLYAGRLSPDKGVHTVLESLDHINQEYPTLRYECSIYGRGAPGYVDRLKNYVAEHNLEDRIYFKGIVPREQMPGVFNEHDILLFPSIWDEPLARIIQEAMGCGLVVIGTDTGGTKEILEDGVTGFTFEPESTEMLAEKILMVLKDAPLRAEIAMEARRKVELDFSLSRMVDEIEQSFTNLVKQEQAILD